MLEFLDGEAESQTTPSSTSSQLSSPKNVKKLQHSIANVEKDLKNIKNVLDEISPSLNRKINKVFSGSILQAELSAQQGSDLDCYLQASHNHKWKTTCWCVNVGGPLYIKDANRQIEEWKAMEMREEWEKCGRHLVRDEKKRQHELTEQTHREEINGGPVATATEDQENLPYYIDTELW